MRDWMLILVPFAIIVYFLLYPGDFNALIAVAGPVTVRRALAVPGAAQTVRPARSRPHDPSLVEQPSLAPVDAA